MDLSPLYSWYAREKRDLPFRRTRDAYAIWVSEVMLQQTRVAHMLPRYEEFLKRFPDIPSLARASEDDVLAAWRGLGYYSRARNLQRGAQKIVAEHQGRFPGDLSSALALPGVGAYTAAAVLSIAYDAPTAALDGNIKRVLTRLYALESEVERKDRALARRADELLALNSSGAPGDHNQALMELGARVCTPGRPRCEICPLVGDCASYLRGGVEFAASLPPGARTVAETPLELTLYWINSSDGERTLVVRESDSRFFRKLWFFPYAWRGLDNAAEVSPPGFRALLDSGLLHPVVAHDSAATARRAGSGAGGRASFRHSITRYRISGAVEELELQGDPNRILAQLRAAGPADWEFAPRAELEERVVSSLAKKAFAARARRRAASAERGSD